MAFGSKVKSPWIRAVRSATASRSAGPAAKLGQRVARRGHRRGRDARRAAASNWYAVELTSASQAPGAIADDLFPGGDRPAASFGGGVTSTTARRRHLQSVVGALDREVVDEVAEVIDPPRASTGVRIDRQRWSRHDLARRSVAARGGPGCGTPAPGRCRRTIVWRCV